MLNSKSLPDIKHCCLISTLHALNFLALPFVAILNSLLIMFDMNGTVLTTTIKIQKIHSLPQIGCLHSKGFRHGLL